VNFPGIESWFRFFFPHGANESCYADAMTSSLFGQRPVTIFDLHGQTVIQAVTSAEQFLRSQARARPGAIVRLITGRGSQGGGAPIRTRVRTLLRRMKDEPSGVIQEFVLEESEGSFLVRLGKK
jgi:DNA-nicking Smr family endonuclease